MTTSDVRLDRRSLLRAAGGLSSTVLLPGLARSAAVEPTTITVADPGGPYGPAYRKAFYDPFERATGIKVVNVARQAEPVAQFKAMVESRSYIWDVCTLTLTARDRLQRQNLLEPLNLPAADAPGVMAQALSPVWLGIDVYSTIQAYRVDHFKDRAPASWADFWNVGAFPGRRSLSNDPSDTLEQALLADGVALDALYPLNVDRAFKSLDRIKPHVSVWWRSGAQSSQLIQSGEVDLIALWNARAQAVVDAGAPVKIVWNEGLYSIEGWGIPKGGPKTEAARRFVKFCVDPARQAAFTEILSYGPTNLNAYKDISPARAATLPTAPENLKLMALSREDWWTANTAAVTERFQAWILD